MRTIKFRGKRLDNGEWVVGFYQPRKNGNVIFIGDYGGLTDIPKLHKVLPESVGQWTGLVDRHGKEIYEGDICKIIILPEEEKVNPIKALLYVIQWGNACWGFKPLFPDLVNPDDKEWRPFWDDESGEMWRERYFEIVGNLIDSPELMEVE